MELAVVILRHRSAILTSSMCYAMPSASTPAICIVQWLDIALLLPLLLHSWLWALGVLWLCCITTLWVFPVTVTTIACKALHDTDIVSQIRHC